MATSQQLRRLVTNPTDMIRFHATGRLPKGIRPSGPLIDLLLALSPRDRCAIVSVTVGPSLGYTGSMRFDTAEAALRWVRPADEVFDSFPADSWRDKRFTKRLYLDDLLKSAKYPDGLLTRYPNLRRSQSKKSGD